VAALGRLVLSKRERVIALEAYDKGLLGTTLRLCVPKTSFRLTSATMVLSY
jgi:non-homologous end joining protein Ku